MKCLVTLCAIVVAMTGAGARAHKLENVWPPPGDCKDDDGVDRCDLAQHRRVLALYRLQPIDKHMADGDTVRRAFFVDGYGKDLVAISFVRPLGGDPVLQVHVPAAEGEQARTPLTAAVPAPVWRDLIDRSAHFDKALAQPPKPKKKSKAEEEGELILCLHSWVYTVEAADRAEEEGKPGAVRRKTEDACDDGLAKVFASELAKAALPLLPQCVLLDPSQHRNLPSVLSACTILSGDRLAAAEVMNALEVFQHVGDASDTSRLGPVFGYDAALNWQGTLHAASGQAPKVWAAKVSEGQGARLVYEVIEGISADRVRFVGFLGRWIKTGQDKTRQQRARVEQIWVRDGNGFAIERATVGPWEEH